MKRLSVLLLVALMLVLSFSSCSDTPDYQSIDDSTALTIGSREISVDLFRYFYLSFKNQNPEYTDEKLTELTENSLREIVSALDTADEYKMSLPEETRNEIEESIATLKEAYDTEEEYYSFLAQGYLSEQVYYDIQLYYALEDLLYSYMTDDSTLIIRIGDAELEKAFENDFMAAINIIIPKESTAESATATGDELTGKALAESLRERILAGEDISELAERYSTDSYTKARYFAPYTMQQYFEDMVKSLEVGEVSEVYESDLGYNITKRVELDRAYITDNYESLRDECQYSEFLKIMLEKAAAYSISYSESFSPETLK